MSIKILNLGMWLSAERRSQCHRHHLRMFIATIGAISPHTPGKRGPTALLPSLNAGHQLLGEKLDENNQLPELLPAIPHVYLPVSLQALSRSSR
ncbi:hypothetical protein O3P69_008724 [Scylla paramamosain]|uniref:Uncharacterized protein n=1 Tax=Scylla paramamosain TaxID=85552 RepID=A0AAW0SLC8_SCYPA